MTSSGIEPATFRFVAQNPNHRAIAVPAKKVVRHEFNGCLNVLFRINGVNVRLLTMMSEKMVARRSCNIFRTATYKQSEFFRIGLSVNPVCRCWQHKRNLNTILLHNLPQCFYLQNWLTDNMQIFQNLGINLEILGARSVTHSSNVLGGWGPQILRPTIQNSDHHDNPAPGIFSALFFPLVYTRSSTDLGRNLDNVQCAFVYIYRKGNGAQPHSSHCALQRARVEAK